MIIGTPNVLTRWKSRTTSRCEPHYPLARLAAQHFSTPETRQKSSEKSRSTSCYRYCRRLAQRIVVRVARARLARYDALVGSIYLAATILGLGVLLFQAFFSGGGADASDGLEIHGDLDGADHVPMLNGAGADALHIDHESDGLAHADGGHGGFLLSTIGLFLSVRTWTYGLTAFGLVGGLITWFGLTSAGVALALAIGFGLVAGLSVSLIFRGLTKPVSSGSSATDAVGMMAHVTVGMTKGSLGKIRLTLKGKRVDYLARTDADKIEVGQSVIVIGFAENHALVEPLRELDAVSPNTPDNQ